MNIESTKRRNQSSIELRSDSITFRERVPSPGGWCRSLGRRMRDGWGIEGMVFEASGGHASGNKPSTERRRNSKGSHGRVKKKVKEEEIVTEVEALMWVRDWLNVAFEFFCCWEKVLKALKKRSAKYGVGAIWVVWGKRTTSALLLCNLSISLSSPFLSLQLVEMERKKPELYKMRYNNIIKLSPEIFFFLFHFLLFNFLFKSF